MNTGVKVIGAVVIVALVGMGGMYFYSQSKLNDLEQRINQTVTQFEPQLPAGATQTNVFKKGAFQSTGIYTIDYKEQGEQNKLVVNYTIDHSFMNQIKGIYDIKMNTQLEGDLRKSLNYEGPLVISSGTVSNQGNFDIKSVSPKITFQVSEEESRTSVAIEPSSQEVSYNDKSKEVKTIARVPKMIITEENPYLGVNTLDINNTVITRDFNLNQGSLGALDIEIASIENPQFKFNKVDIVAKAGIENDKYSLEADVKVDNIIVPALQEEKGKLEIAYSVKGIDKASVEYFKALYDKKTQQSETGEMTENEVNQNIEQFKVLLSKGLTVSLDRFMAQGNFGLFDISGKYEITAQPLNTFNLENNSKIDMSVKAQGQVVPMLALGIYSIPDFSQVVEQMKNSQNPVLDIRTSYNQGKFSVNGQDVERSMIAPQIQSTLEEADYKLGFKKEVPANPGIAPELPKPQAIPAPSTQG